MKSNDQQVLDAFINKLMSDDPAAKLIRDLIISKQMMVSPMPVPGVSYDGRGIALTSKGLAVDLSRVTVPALKAEVRRLYPEKFGFKLFGFRLW